jgi:hypothetical protein
VAALQCGNANSQKIEIKGLRLGMTNAEVEAKVGPLPLTNFTVAGASSKYTDASPEFYEGKLDSFSFYFNAEQFDDVLGAVKSKYPALRCVKSKVANAMGASFTQVNCQLRDTKGALHLTRFVNDISTSSLTLTSDRRIKEWVKEEKSRQNDL